MKNNVKEELFEVIKNIGQSYMSDEEINIIVYSVLKNGYHKHADIDCTKCTRQPQPECKHKWVEIRPNKRCKKCGINPDPKPYIGVKYRCKNCKYYNRYELCENNDLAQYENKDFEPPTSQDFYCNLFKFK